MGVAVGVVVGVRVCGGSEGESRGSKGERGCVSGSGGSVR